MSEYRVDDYYEYAPNFFIKIVDILPENDSSYINQFVLFKDRLHYCYFNSDINMYIWKDVSNFPKGEIEILKDDGNFMMCRMSCGCLDPHHSVTSCLEYDSGQVYLNVNGYFYWLKGYSYDKIYVSYNENFLKRFFINTFINFPYRIFERIKAALKILFLGHLENTQDFCFRSKDQIKEYATYLLMSIDRIESYEKIINLKDSDKSK